MIYKKDKRRYCTAATIFKGSSHENDNYRRGACCRARDLLRRQRHDLSYTGADFSLTATLDTTSLGGGDYLVTGLVGTVTDGGGPEAITLLAGGPGVFSSPSGAFQLNNVLHSPPDPTSFDFFGLGFTASGDEWNLCAANVGGCPAVYTLFQFNPSTGALVTDSGSVIVSEIPEPATWAMLSLAFVGFI